MTSLPLSLANYTRDLNVFSFFSVSLFLRLSYLHLFIISHKEIKIRGYERNSPTSRGKTSAILFQILPLVSPVTSLFPKILTVIKHPLILTPKGKHLNKNLLQTRDQWPKAYIFNLAGDLRILKKIYIIRDVNKRDIFGI